MGNLSDYYRELLAWENNPHRQLVDAWPSALISKIESNIRASVSGGAIIGLLCPIRIRSTNQSIGNQVEEFVLPRLAANLSDFRLTKCSGAGYPDQLLTEIISNLRIPLEVKATSDWNENDSKRRVLTSSSEKYENSLRRPFIICCLLCSITFKAI